MSRSHLPYRKCLGVALVLAIVLLALPAVLNAQDETPPKWDVFLGYQWLNPGGNVPSSDTPPVSLKLPSMATGAAGTVTYNFDKWWGLSGDVGTSYHSGYSEHFLSAGPRLMWRGEGVNFFAHTMLGVNMLHLPTTPTSNGLGAVLGGGMDLKLGTLVDLRLFEADYVLGRHNFSGVASPLDPQLRRPILNGAALRTGLVFKFGGGEPEALPAASCSVDKSQVMVGEPIHATVVPTNFNPKHTLTYTWASSGGKIEGKDAGATIDTNGVAGGSYTTTATVTDPKAKKNNTASCTGNFTVTEPPKNPPQMSCSANPTTLQAGASSTITCTCTSPDNVPVTVGGWSATGGSISGSGNSATLSTAGAQSGPITINATCTDSRGLTASSSSSVTVENPPPPPPKAAKVNECEYPNVNKPWRVDNTCKAMLDDIAGKLQQDPDSKLVVVGNSGPKEKRKNLAAERAVDVKYYITQGEAQQHIDPSRIECRTGNAGTNTTEHWIIPAGATFPNADSTTVVDEKKVKAILDHPKPAAKKAAKKAP